MEPDFPNFSLNLGFQDSENETPNKRIKKMTDEELEKSIDDQKSLNSRVALQNLHNAPGKPGLNKASLRRNPLKLSQELVQMLALFYWNIRTAGGRGGDFEPSSLKIIQRGLDRYLQEKGSTFSIIGDEDFSKANKALDANVKFPKKSGKGNKPNAAQPLSAEMIEEMWLKNVLGKHDGEALTNVNFLKISQQFGFRSRQEHHQLKFGDFKTVCTGAGKYVEWSLERMRNVAANERNRSSTPKCGRPATKKDAQ